MQAIEQAFAKSGASDPTVVVDAVIAALAGRSSSVVVVGKGTGAFMLLSRLPVGLRDRLIRSALGVPQALKPL
jgi:hypothetical protein